MKTPTRSLTPAASDLAPAFGVRRLESPLSPAPQRRLGPAHSMRFATLATVIFAFILHTSCFIPSAAAQTTAFTYQGFLTVQGAPATGTNDFEIRLYNAASAGAQQGSTVTLGDVGVTNGLFTVTLDFTASPFTGQALWLDIAVRPGASAGAYTNLVPRQPITAVPYAITAGTVESPANVIPVWGMVWIKPGQFIMGSRADEPGWSSDGREGPQTVVTLTKGFWMGVHEVTQGEYEAVVGSYPSSFTGDTNRPVEQVTWHNATNYCRLLTLSERTAGRIPAGWGYRLPTEAEWEYCCRAGARTTRFSYGDDVSATALGNYAWYSANSVNTTHPVEQKQANPWGLMDMHGNVFEWCQDWFGTYPGGSVTDPQGPGSGVNRVVRGGGWFFSAVSCRSAARGEFGPGNASFSIGFRVVLSPGQP